MKTADFDFDLPGELIAQRRIGIYKRRPRHVQPHDFHQQLVAVGGAVKRTGAGAVVRRRLTGQQFGFIYFTFSEFLPRSGFVFI